MLEGELHMTMVKNKLKSKGVINNSDYLEGDIRESFEQLKENVYYSQQIFGIGSWTYDILKDEVFCTEGIYHILESSPENFDSKLEHLYSYVHPDDIEKLKGAIQNALEGREYDLEYRIITSNGKEKYIYEKVKVLLSENRKPAKIIGVMQDITERKIIENDLRVLGENSNQVQRMSGTGSWKYDVLKDEFYGTEEMYKIYGINPQDFTKDFKNALKLVHPEDQVKLQSALEQHLAGKSCEIEYRILQPDGTVKFVIAKAEPQFNERKEVIAVLGTLQDITEKKVLEEELRKNSYIISKTEALAHVGSWEMDVVNKKIYWSEEAYRIYGIAPEEYDGTYEVFLKFVHPDDRTLVEKSFENPPEKQPFDMEFRIIRHDGSVRDVHKQVECKFDENRKPIYIYGTIQDITEKKELQKKADSAQEEINRIQRRFQAIIQKSNDVFGIITSDGTIEYISQGVERITGYKPEKLIGKNAFKFFEKEELKKLTGMVESVLMEPGKTVHGDISLKIKKDREIFLEGDMSNQLSAPSIQGILLYFRDVTKKIELEKKMKYIATHDELTKLPNVVYFNEQIKKQCEDAKEEGYTFALMKLEIDEIKYVNNTLGYELGDELLIQTSQRLKAFLGEERFICRHSGDRFAIIIPRLKTIEEYENKAREIIDIFSQPFRLKMYEVNVTVNIGISVFPNDAQDSDDVLKHANSALTLAKLRGKNKYEFYYPNMDVHNYKRFTLRNDLYKAAEKEQFRVYYQPQVSLSTGEILAAEALIRWEHPTWGLVPPNEFIPLAEETGLVVNLGNWMLREVCLNYKRWLESGLPAIKVSINYSSIQFLEENLVDNIGKTIAEFGLNPNFLIIEITESILQTNFEQVRSNIKKLHALGIQVALDDFGTGFSSLACLNSFSIDILKIDRSFIKNIPSDETSTILTRSIINLAKELKIKLVAEGIETWEQLLYLRELKCYTGQGYLYSKPVPTKEFEKILEQGKYKPVADNIISIESHKERRRFYRIELPYLLETDMTILEVKGQKTKVGNTKVLVKNVGPGGICFVSNIRFPANREIILQFTTQILGQEIRVHGYPVWTKELDHNIYQYGIEFTIDEDERMNLTSLLDQIRVKLQINSEINDRRFILDSPLEYFMREEEAK